MADEVELIPIHAKIGDDGSSASERHPHSSTVRIEHYETASTRRQTLPLPVPGITGIIATAEGIEPLRQVKTMVHQMHHDYSWNSGCEAFPILNAALGWTFRSGQSCGGGQTTWNADRTIGLIFAGEEFGRLEPSVASRRRAEEPTSLAGLLHLYEDLGPRFVSELNGWFAGILIDLREQQAFLFNDRYGLGRVYVHESPEGICFASEAKALLAIRPAARQIDLRGLAEFVSVGCVMQNRTLFQGVSLLPPGSLWTFHRNGRVAKERYFDSKTWEEQEPLSPEDYLTSLQEIFGRVAPRYLRGSVGMSLTGGLDSRMLLAWGGAEPGSLPCYTFGGPYRDCADVRLARRLAALAGQPHTTLQIGEDFLRDFPALAERAVYLSDGAMDVSGAVELHANARAREIAPIRVTGNYGSEILRENVAFRPRRLDRSLYTPEFCLLLDEAEETYRVEATGSRLSFIAFKQIPWHHHARLSVEQSQLTVRSPFLDNELVALAYRVPPSLTASPQPALALIFGGNPRFADMATDRALRHRPRSATDRLSHLWQEFTAKAEYAYDYGMPKRLAQADHLLSALRLERLFLGRHKFYHFRVWYKRHLKGCLQTLASSCGQLACYRPGAPRQLVVDHLSGRENRTLALHQLFSIQLIHRLFAESR